MFKRVLDITNMVEKKSHFVLGPRQTGKSTLLRTCFPTGRFIDLLEADTFRQLAARPELMRERLKPEDHMIIVDEIQKLPELLDEIQLLLDRHPKLRFVLTGSSARKLKRGQANLLPGRTWTTNLFPLVYPEIPDVDLSKRLCFGNLPGVLTSAYPEEELRAYVGTYLKEEIQAEGLSRSIGNFARFLEMAASCNGEQVNFAGMANDTGIPVRTLRDYFGVLEDTMLATLVPVFQKTPRRKPVSTPKFYFFDLGVANVLRRELSQECSHEESGRRLEHLIFHELNTALHYNRSEDKLTYWRTRTGLEVDFVIGEKFAVEVKAKAMLRSADLSGLCALGEECPNLRRIVVSFEKEYRKIDGIEIFPVQLFLKELWSGLLLG